MDDPANSAMYQSFSNALENVGGAYRVQLEALRKEAVDEIRKHQQYIEFLREEATNAVQARDQEIENLKREGSREIQFQHSQAALLNAQLESKNATINALRKEKDRANEKTEALESRCTKLAESNTSISNKLHKQLTEIEKRCSDQEKSYQVKLTELKEALRVEQLAYKRSEEVCRVRADKISKLKEAIRLQKLSEKDGTSHHQADNMPSSSTTPQSKRKSLSVTDESTSGDVHESDTINREREAFLLDLLQSFNKFDFPKFQLTQSRHATVTTEEDPGDREADCSKKAFDSVKLAQRLSDKYYTSVTAFEKEVKHELDQKVFSKTCQNLEKQRAIELYYAFKTKMMKLPAANSLEPTPSKKQRQGE